jgi:arylsulfatase
MQHARALARIAGGVALAVGLAGPGTVASPPELPAWRELAEEADARRGDAWVPVPRVVEAGRVGVELAPASELEFALRPPAGAELVVDAAPGVWTPSLSVHADGAAGWQPAALVPADDGTRRAALAPFAESPVRLRLANPTATAQRVWRPRIVAPPAAPRPLLELAPRPEGLKRPNVVLYVVDTLRRDRLSLHGYGRDTSPGLERLAAAGAFVFERAYAPGSFTTPSITALFGGLAPSAISGSLRAGGAVQRTLAEAFRDAGYRTSAFQANYRLVGGLGYARGFEQWRILRRGDASRPEAARAEQVQAAALAWLDAQRPSPFFLYLQTMDVHAPYDPPPPFSGRYTPPAEERLGRMTPEQRAAIAQSSPETLALLRSLDPDQYDAAVAYTDHAIERFLAALAERGLAEDTVVAITSDHGEPLGQRGELLHGRSLHEELVRIPLVLVVPWQRAARRIEPVVGLADLGPTLLELAGVEPPPGATARSLLAPRDPREAPFAFGEQLDNHAVRTLSWYAREGRFKLILDGSGAKLYDLDADPGETTDVRAAHPAQALTLEARLRTHSPSLRPGAKPATPAAEALREKEREELDAALRALGYAE